MASFTPEQIEQFLQEFFDVVGKRQYIGARYVPIFGRKGEDTFEWDNLAPYEPLTVVMHEGVSYVSRQYVPEGVNINNTDYWFETYRFNAQVEQYRQTVLTFEGRIEDIESALPIDDFENITVHDYIDQNDTTLENTLTGALVPYPIVPESKYGTVGQVLTTKGNGQTTWQNPVVPDAQATGRAVNEWLENHPEATTTVLDGAITTPKLANGAVTNAKLDPNGLIQYDFAIFCINDLRTYQIIYNIETKVLSIPTGMFICRNGRGYASSAQTLNLTDSLSSQACILKVDNNAQIYGVPWNNAASLNTGDKIIGYIYASNVYINGVDQSRIRVTNSNNVQLNPTMADRVALFTSTDMVTYDFTTKTLSIPRGFACIGHMLIQIEPQTVDLSSSLAFNAGYIRMTSNGEVYCMPYAGTIDWASVRNQTDALLGLVYEKYISINGFPDSRIAVKASTGFISTSLHTGTVGVSDDKIIVFDMGNNTLSIPQCFFDSPLRGGNLARQDVDVSIRTTSAGACMLWINDSKAVVATTYGAEKAPSARAIYIGYIYDKMVRIFGQEDVNIFIKNMPSVVWCFGDSITAGVGATVPYHQVWNRNNMRRSFKNWGIGSTGYVVETNDNVIVGGGVEGQGTALQQSNNNNVLKVMQSVNGTPYCITIAAGTNDWSANVPLADFRTSVAATLAYALTKCSRVLAISPIRRNASDTNGLGLTLDDYAQVIEEECASHGTKFASGFDVFFDPRITANRNAFAPDGLHPNNAGHAIMAQSWYDELLEVLGGV